MKKLLQIMSVMTLTTITTINLTACELFQKSPPVDWNQRLSDAANLIGANSDVKFTTFFYNKNETQKVLSFKDNIIKRIEILLYNATEDYSMLLYKITNLDDTINATTTIKLELSVYDTPNIKKTCNFVTNFTDIQSFVDKALDPYTDSQKINKKHFTLNKKEKNSETKSFYDILIGYGANFKQQIPDKPNTFKTSDSGELGKASDFWNAFQTAKGDEKTKTAYLGNVLSPIFQCFGLDDMGGLTFFNFEATLHDNDVIVLTGHKNFAGKDYDYIEINIKVVKTDDVNLGNSFKGLTYIFEE